MTYVSYFRGAVWTPVALFPPVWLLDTVMSTRAPITLEQIFLIYVLALGTVAYFIFAIWASHKIKIKTESEILRLAWWAPVIFIPFYGTPWIIYGLINILLGDMSGLGMLFMWLAYTPYFLITGYVFSAIFISIYKVVNKS